ncbi:adenylate/guanylate cyclase domain-containing protein [Nocardia sp. CDC160]|uniref:adenylate/guanylate cyclase domain-containing protein n=1 Tax=Nocardia sp. CDC160 TaxID=3112166 RepID=UPI002DBCB482|nr:adenylate/guanylate cyclase domain-containing protein [Nocardia sp. CDC160]MEC3918664.1 adenylate/guanylate cyclase domain-containing protein [Nocardia sp. CDC160]
MPVAVIVVRLLGGPEFRLAVAWVVVAVAAIAEIALTVVVMRETWRWFGQGTEPDERQRGRALRLPARVALLQAMAWAVLGLVLVAVQRDSSWRLQLLIVLAAVVGGAVSSLSSYLMGERILRPVRAAALAGQPPLPLPRHGVEVRMLISWFLFTGSALVLIVVLVIDQYLGSHVIAVHDVRGPVLAAAVLGLYAGIVGTTLAARSVSDPLREVTKAMAAIARGELSTRVAVYDTAETGVLQAGFNAMAEAVEERERLHDLFGRHVGRDVASHALRNGTGLTGELRIVAVLFIDLAGSTSFAATHMPDAVASMLNDFFRLVVSSVDEHGGFINKFEGDAALAIFGAPVEISDPAGATLRAARELAASLESAPGMLDFGIGVAYGTVFAGNIGAEDRYEYTVIGDAVNQSARLSDLAKARPGRVLAAREVVDAAASTEAEHWRNIDTVILRGRSAPTDLVTPIAQPR